MKLKFSVRDYQETAIQSVIDLFKDMETNYNKFDISKTAIPQTNNKNIDYIDDRKLLDNLKNVQTQNNRDEAPIEMTANFNERDFTIEMETGTGKTFVYLNTIMELNKQYGWNKFVIVVPSVAIREGVLTEFKRLKLEMEQNYKKTIFAYNYNSQNLSVLESYHNSSYRDIMIMTMQSFNKDENVLNKDHLDKSYSKPMKLLSEVRPIVILDEPQKIGGDATKAKLNDFNALILLRYSATHNEIKNLVFRYTPLDAYLDDYVKKIEVMSIYGNNEKDFDAYIEASEVGYDKNDKLFAQIKFYRRDGVNVKLVSRKIRNVGYDLFDKSNGMVEYKGYVVSEINTVQKYVKFKVPDLDRELLIHENDRSQDKNELMKFQIKETLREHFEKELLFNDLLKRNVIENPIKVLSLFFIDKVANFRGENGENGKIATWFEEAYSELTNEKRYSVFKVENIDNIYKGYFAIDSVRENNRVIYKDTKKENNEDREAYKLIMQNKEQLLSIQEPVRFIFSHSALREGWDNPNVFQICTLNETIKESRKRQEIGRGLRLPVDTEGNRIRNEKINILTIIANESYDTFARTLQEEISKETGIELKKNMTNNGRSKETSPIAREQVLNDHFKSLWQNIKRKTKYEIDVSNKEIVDYIVKELKESGFKIKENKFKVQKNLINELSLDDELKSKITHDMEEKKSTILRIPNLLKRISDITGITKRSIASIIDKANLYQDIYNNPDLFINHISYLINDNLPGLLFDKVQYNHIKQCYSLNIFEDEVDVYTDSDLFVDNLDTNRTLYTRVMLDSDTEKNIIKDLDRNHSKIKFYIKLPKKIGRAHV